MSYCLYLRKSRSDMDAEARGEGETLARHERALVDLAKRLHLNVTEIYREVVSGDTIAARPVMQRLLLEVEQGVWEGVLVMEVERLARGDTIDQGIVAQTFKFSDTRIITPIKTYDPANEYDEEYFEFGLFMSRREYKTINRRLQRGRKASVMEGKYVSSRPPYGYRRVKLEREKGYTLEIVPEEAEIVRMIFDLYTIGETQPDGSRKRMGVSLIARRLNMMAVPSATGREWVSVSIRDMLINPVYIGKVRWNWRPNTKRMSEGRVKISRPRSDPKDCIIADGRHPAIISKETFDAAQAMIAMNPPRPISVKNSVKNPLSGLIVCGVCGRRMVRRPYGPDGRTDTLMCQAPKPICTNVSSDLVYVERRVLSSLADWLEEYKLRWNENPTGEASMLAQKRRAEKRMTDELKTLQKQIDNVHDLLEQGIYSTETFLERSRALTEKITKAKADLNAIQGEIETEIALEEGRKNIIPKVQHLLAVYDSLPNAQAKNDMLKEVLEKAVYTKPQSARWHGSPDNFDLVLYPRLPVSQDKK